MENLFKYSFNEKRYHTYNYYLKTKYNCKVAKIILDAHFSCPNRDGSKSSRACIFCSNKGSGDSNFFNTEDLLRQYELNKKIMDNKWPNEKYIPYFQSFSNTYGPLNKIKSMIELFINKEEVCEIAIATRCDCIEDDVLDYLGEINKIKPITLELGLQSSNDNTGIYINRCHTFDDFKNAVKKVKEKNIRICAHIINGLPSEDRKDMIETIKDLRDVDIDGIKIHMLHIVRNSRLGDVYLAEPFELISREEYIDIVVEQLRYLKKEIVIERLTGDPIVEDLLYPSWVTNKTTILNDIDKLMRKLDVYQGDLYE